MAANMDGVGELTVAEKLNEYGMITSLTKQHDVKKIKQNKNIKKIYSNIALSVGIKKEDFLRQSIKKFSFLNLFVLMLQMDIQNISLISLNQLEINILLKQ